MMKYDRQAFVVYRDIKEKLPGGWGRPLVDENHARYETANKV